MIFVTVGTHEDPFDRLVLAAQELGARTDERVVVQHGTSAVRSPDCEAFAFASPDRIRALVAEARVVMLHGGPSTLREAMEQGVPCIVIPRDPLFGEHVDDHQLRYSRTLRAPVVVHTDPMAAVQRILDGWIPPAPHPPVDGGAAVTAHFCARLDEVLQDVVKERVSWTARLSGILYTVLGRKLSPK